MYFEQEKPNRNLFRPLLAASGLAAAFATPFIFAEKLFPSAAAQSADSKRLSDLLAKGLIDLGYAENGGHFISLGGALRYSYELLTNELGCDRRDKAMADYLIAEKYGIPLGILVGQNGSISIFPKANSQQLFAGDKVYISAKAISSIVYENWNTMSDKLRAAEIAVIKRDLDRHSN